MSNDEIIKTLYQPYFKPRRMNTYFVQNIRSIASIFILFLCSLSFGWTQVMDSDVEVILNDGKKISGTLDTYVPNEYVKIRIADQIITIDAQQIKRVNMGTTGVTRDTFKLRRWYNRTHFSTMFNQNGIGFGIKHSIQYAFANWMLIGAGIGIDNYYLSSVNNVFPVYIDMRSNLIQSKNSPFIGLRAGYGFVHNIVRLGQTQAIGGAYVSPIVGYRLGANKMSVDLFCGLAFQRVSYRFQNALRSDQKILFRRTEIGVAVQF